MTARTKKPLDFYTNQKYAVTLIPGGDGWFAEIPDLPGCMTEGDTPEEVLEMIEDARLAWIETAYGDGDDIPLPHYGIADPQYAYKSMHQAGRTPFRVSGGYLAAPQEFGVAIVDECGRTVAVSCDTQFARTACARANFKRSSPAS